jgi:hypothetical protein
MLADLIIHLEPIHTRSLHTGCTRSKISERRNRTSCTLILRDAKLGAASVDRHSPRGTLSGVYVVGMGL